jgi:ribosomal protein S18 acetylase RimI-like enzyme
MDVVLENLSSVPSEVLVPLMADENAKWQKILNWDYSSVHRFIRQFARQGLVQGIALMREGTAIGYTYMVAVKSKALLGNIYLLESEWGKGYEAMLAESITTLIQGLDNITRLESQPMIFSGANLSGVWNVKGCDKYRRFYLSLPLAGEFEQKECPQGFELKSWKSKMLPEASSVIFDSYQGGVDAEFASNFQSLPLCNDFTDNLINRDGCGHFSKNFSTVAFSDQGKLAGIVIASQLADGSAHMPQISVHPDFHGSGLGAFLVNASIHQMKKAGFNTVSLTVTEKNELANKWYRRIGFEEILAFDAVLWQRKK